MTSSARLKRQRQRQQHPEGTRLALRRRVPLHRHRRAAPMRQRHQVHCVHLHGVEGGWVRSRRQH